ncbi:hypothetical protein, partial [Ruminococcus flavefaciens]|uniref:hypothetical protein n=1 Tax=Ruminococcus flavefaciens TaxID=1265 RepID=UPI002A91C331
KDQQFQRRRSPTCGTKKFKATISSRCLIYAYFRFWVFYDCTFLDNSSPHRQDKHHSRYDKRL